MNCIDPVGVPWLGVRPGDPVTPQGRNLGEPCPDPRCSHAIVAHRYDNGLCSICHPHHPTEAL